MAIELSAQARKIFGKQVKTLRKQGLVPAEIYGREAKNQSIQIPEMPLKKALLQAGNTNLISIKVDNSRPIQALARDIQYSPVKQSLLHVDFYAVMMNETVSVGVPIQFIGETDLVTQEGGTLVLGLNELDVEALPADLPESIEVDISVLQSFSDSISVSDMAIPEKITVHSSPDSMVATVQPPRIIETEEEEIEEEVEVSAEVPTIRDEETEE